MARPPASSTPAHEPTCPQRLTTPSDLCSCLGKGSRVRLSEKGLDAAGKQANTMRQRLGLVIRIGWRASNRIVQWDGSPKSYPYHVSYLERVDG